MWQTIKTLAHHGTTIFLTTQYLDEADELADTIALLHKGTIVASGTARELKKLVPSGLVELSFQNEQQLKAATCALDNQYSVTQNGDLTLTVVVGDHVAGLAELFIRLRDAQIEPVDFSQRVPTLDDVFFKLTSDTQEGN
jgi:ABC-2 type transport system ATP-binding protein